MQNGGCMEKVLKRRFPGRRVVITGAGSGLGRALAVDFARLGWSVGVNDIDLARAEETLGLVEKNGGRGFAMKGDVAKWADVSALADEAVARFNGADIVVNNAGVPAAGTMEKIPIEDWQWIVDINLMGVIYGCKAFIPVFKEKGAGHVVNIASSAGFVSLPEMSPYNVTKAGVISLSETLRQELAGHNIGVTVACPTFFKTNLMDQCRYTDPRQLDMANALFEKSLCAAEKVSRHIIRSVAKKRLYVITQIDGRLLWKLKRYMPEKFYKFMGFFYRKGYADKFLGVEPAHPAR